MIPRQDRIEYGGCLVGQEEEDAILQTIRFQGRRRWTIGPESVKFEEEIAEKSGVKHSVLVNSGSSALLAAILALKLGDGAKVVIPGLTFPTAYSPILQAGYMPVVVDCDKTTLNLDYNEVEKALEEHPDIKAVVAVNIAGNSVDVERLRKIVGPDRYIVLDNCDGFGCTIDGDMMESLVDVSTISMHAAHIISMGEGGAVITNNKEIADRARKIREWGRASGSDNITQHEGFPPDYRERYVFEEIGYNLKPLELQCAMGRVQLRRLYSFKADRARVHDALTEVFKKYPEFEMVQQDADNAENCWFSFAFHCVDVPRPVVMDFLENMNIETRTVFSGNILKHPAYKNQPHIQIGDLDNCNYVMENSMFIGSPPFYTEEQIEYIDRVISILVKEYAES